MDGNVWPDIKFKKKKKENIIAMIFLVTCQYLTVRYESAQYCKHAITQKLELIRILLLLQLIIWAAVCIHIAGL